MLRGGPDVFFDPYSYTIAGFNTDKGKRLMFKFEYVGDHNTNGYNIHHIFTPSLTWRLGNHIYLTGQFDYDRNRNNLQYVTTIFPTNSIESVHSPQYVLGRMEQRTYGLTIKVQANITPDISFQFYGSPFTSTGSFENFKTAADTKSRTYLERFRVFEPDEISYNDRRYTVNREGMNYAFNNPDFSFNEFRSNLVARWEYMPGSTLYLVWEHRMSNNDNRYVSGWGQNLDHLFGLPATNTFMVKLNYWFNL